MRTTAPNALEGVTVLDLTRLLPGAYCSQMLADLGAEVIKVEQRDGGDYNRAWYPRHRYESGSFLLLNRNKKSITLDLKKPEGKEILRSLVRNADILLEGFRPGVMDRLGLSYDSLSEENPRLIFCSISGYGQDGPYRLKPGHDLNYMAEAGALQLFGKAGEGPIVPGLSIADVGGGSLMATTGILAALFARGHTGRGQYVDVSMHDGTISWLALHGAEYLFGKVEPRGGERPFIGQGPCYNVYRCSDGKFVALGIIEDHFWHRFCDHVGLAELKDQQWPEGEEAERQKAILASLFGSRERDAWVTEFAAIDIPFGPVLDMEEMFDDPHVRHRQMLQTVEHPVEGTIPQLGFPVKYSGTPCTIRSAPPLLGEHTDAILSGIGLSPERIRALRSDGVV
ncbi:MAG: CoA transferase [Rhizorhabdus sp.]|nr:MAG: CoA transferase [Rhizorhabdus sp.]